MITINIYFSRHLIRTQLTPVNQGTNPKKTSHRRSTALKSNHLIFTVIAVVIIVVASTAAYTLINQSPSYPTTSTPTPTPASTNQPSAEPSNTEQPKPTSTPQSTSTVQSTSAPPAQPRVIGQVTIVDATGANVTVTLPVERIVCLTSAETIYSLGGGSKIVAITGMLTTEVKEVLPASILTLPTVGERDTSPNIEAIIALNPDLIIASQRLSDAHRKKFEDANIPVIEDSITGVRRNTFLTNLGLILNEQQRAAEIINYEQQYWDLVEERVAGLSRDEKPLVYFEWYMAWFSTGPDGSYTGLIEAAGGINLGENSTVSSPQLSSEFVIDQNPDFIIRMLDYSSGEDQASFQALYNSLLSRSGISDLKAVQNNQVHVIKSTVLVERDVIGLLYFAKWLHPDLFTDIDPASVHAEMIQKYYGSSLTGVYSYP